MKLENGAKQCNHCMKIIQQDDPDFNKWYSAQYNLDFCSVLCSRTWSYDHPGQLKKLKC